MPRYSRWAGEEYRVSHPWHLLRRATRYGRPLLWPAVGALGATVVATAARLVGPLVVRTGVDEGVIARDRSVILLAALAYLGILLLQYLASRTSTYSVAWVGERYLRDLRVRVFRHLAHLDIGFFSRSKTGVLVSRMTSDIEAITQFVDEGAVTVITNLLTAGGVVVVMFLVDPVLASAVVALLPILVVASVIFRRYADRAYQEVREQIGRVLGTLQEGLSGLRVVQAYTRERQQAHTFGRVNEGYYRANLSAAKAISWYFPAVDFLRTAGVAVVLLVGGMRVLDGRMSFGTLVAFLLYMDWFFEPIVHLSNIYNLLQAALAALEKLFGVLDTEPEVAEQPGAAPLPEPVEGNLRFEDVTFGYDPKAPVVRSLDLEVQAGERIAVVGETGAGKSTIAKLAVRFYDPLQGRLLLDGHDLRWVSFESLRRRVSLVPQEGFLFSGSLRDNIRYGRPEASDDQIWEVCRAVGIEDWVRTLPERLDTEVRERGGRLSSGERQLVALARALLADPAVIVLDEATSNLDPETEARVEAALSVLLTGRTAIVIAHRLQTAKRADRVIVVADGRIVESGSHEELAGHGRRYARLVDVWEHSLA
ncbi:MAG: ABC transporter ATP-binding protein/permease [Actinomycetota bacterium]|nr:ABC transporter ATP-binding protein/permease [Actinomycetota bacterium]